MTVGDLFLAMARRFSWAAPQVVAEMTPMQTKAYLESDATSPGAIDALIGGGIGAGGSHRFGGKRTMTFGSFDEARKFIAQNRAGKGA